MAAAICLLPATASAMCKNNTNPSLIHNGGFESGTLNSASGVSAWTVFNTSDTHLGITDDTYKGGARSLYFASIGGENRISQHITTTAGSIYTVCFYLSSGQNQGTTAFRAQWNDEDMIVMKNSGVDESLFGTFIYYEFNVEATGADVLSFEGRDDPSALYLDNVDVQLCSSCSINNGVVHEERKPGHAAVSH
jgi:hypothetical protein